MGGDDDGGIWMPIGIVGGLALGVALVPFRTVTSASNLAFPFIALTVVVAELGGRLPALATAAVSAVSLNFFLTEPYLTLAISKTDDLVAFVALAACGLIAAAFGTRRARLSETSSRARTELETLRRLVDQLTAGEPVGDVLDDLRRAFGLGALVLRDEAGRTLATAPSGLVAERVAEAPLSPRTLLGGNELGYRLGARGFRLPEGGGRLSLPTERGPLSLDLWEGDARGFRLDEALTLSVAASILALGLARRPAR